MEGVMLYRKKTLTEAAQWFADGHAKPWAQSAVREMGDHFEIDTREGTLRGEPGDWIARGPQGEVYPIGAEIFAQTYEPADQASAARPATAEDVRLMIREEIRAALREERLFGVRAIDEIAPLARETVERATRMQSALKGPCAKFRTS